MVSIRQTGQISNVVQDSQQLEAMFEHSKGKRKVPVILDSLDAFPQFSIFNLQ